MIINNKNMQNLVTRYIEDESGATAIEYGLLAALIGIAIIGGARFLGQRLNNRFITIGQNLT